MSEEKEKILTCRWCTWSRPRWIKTKNGDSKCGWEALRAHVSGMHPDKFMIIQSKTYAHMKSKVTSQIEDDSYIKFSKWLYKRKNEKNLLGTILRNLDSEGMLNMADFSELEEYVNFLKKQELDNLDVIFEMIRDAYSEWEDTQSLDD